MFNKVWGKWKLHKGILLKISIVILISVIVLASILNFFEIKYGVIIYGILEKTLELLYFLSGIVIVYGLFIAYKQLEIVSKDIKLNYKRLALEKGHDYLGIFAGTILPNINDFYLKIHQDSFVEISSWNPAENDYKLTLEGIGELVPNDEKEILRKLIDKEEKGIQDIFNHLESFSAAVIYGLVDEDVVFQPIGPAFCKFMDREIISFCVARNNGPFENLCKLYKSWSAKLKSNTNALKIAELGSKIEEIEKDMAQASSTIVDNRYLGS